MSPRLTVLVLALLALASPAASALALETPAAPLRLVPPLPGPLGEPLAGAAEAVRVPPVRVEADVSLEPIGTASVRGGSPAPAAPLAALPEAAPPALAAAGALALLQAFGGLRWLGLGAFALYSRLARSNLLDNGHRETVFRLVRENPGLGPTEIARLSGLGWGTTVYHLDRLERAQMVASERLGLHRCYFPAGAVSTAQRRGIGALKTDTTRSIAAFLLERPGASQTDLCETLGLSASAASKQVTKLEAAGLVRREREGKGVRLYPADGLAPLLGEAADPLPQAVPLPRAAPA